MLAMGRASYSLWELPKAVLMGVLKRQEPRVDKLPKEVWDGRDAATLAELIVSCLCCVCVCVCVCVWVGLVAPG